MVRVDSLVLLSEGGRRTDEGRRRRRSQVGRKVLHVRESEFSVFGF